MNATGETSQWCNRCHKRDNTLHYADDGWLCPDCRVHTLKSQLAAAKAEIDGFRKMYFEWGAYKDEMERLDGLLREIEEQILRTKAHFQDYDDDLVGEDLDKIAAIAARRKPEGSGK